MNDETYLDERGREFYKESGYPVWPHRNREFPDREGVRRPLRENRLMERYLNRLDKLEAETRPSTGLESAEQKDLSAFEALQTVGRLATFTAGWAIDHQIGLAMGGHQFVPLQPSGTKEHPQYLSELSAVNKHEHEKAGAAAVTGEIIDPFFIRKCLINLLRSNSGGWPSWLRHHVIEALEALEYGEVSPIFAKVGTGDKRGLTEKRLMLQALALVAYRRELGLTKEKAVEEVSQAMGVSPHTIASWTGRLKNDFGALEVDRTIEIARNHASWVDAARKSERLGEEAPDISDHEQEYDAKALAELARKYKAALKQ